MSMNRQQQLTVYKISVFSYIFFFFIKFLFSTHTLVHTNSDSARLYNLFAFKSIYFLPENEKNKQKKKKSMKRNERERERRKKPSRFISFSHFISSSLSVVQSICSTVWCLWNIKDRKQQLFYDRNKELIKS